MFPYIIAGAIGFVVAKIFEEDDAPKYADGGDVLLAPNGKRSNLTPKQYKLVRTPAFKQWFGDWENSPETSSKVIDENGEPLIVYHGTNSEFNIFDTNSNKKGSDFGSGAYFGNKKTISEMYGERIIGVFLNLRKPLILKDRSLINVIFDEFIDYKNTISNKYFTLKDYIIKNGSDGIVIYNPIMGEETDDTWFVCYEPNQIKLADGTNTTFDGNNPDIRFNVGGSVDDAISKLTSVTPQQKSTIKRIVSTIERANGKQTISVLNIRKGHIVLLVFNVRDKIESITTTTYCDVEINTKGNVTKGFYNYLTPKVETKYPYMEKGGLIAPNGKPSNLTPEQYKLVRTPAFKAWFGDWENDINDNMLVDRNGEPMIWYHTGGNWTELNNDGINGNGKLMFSPTKSSMAYGNDEKKAITRPFFIKSDFIYMLPYEDRDISSAYRWNKNKKNPIWFVNAYGGFIVVRQSNQIKLADGSNTTFDGNNPDIRYAGGGNTQPKDLTKINNFENIYKGVEYYSYSDNLEKQEKADRWYELFTKNQKEKIITPDEYKEFIYLSNELDWEDLD
jgi:hypothetical protein